MGNAKVFEIMFEMRMKYFMGIIMEKAWKAKCLSDEIIEGYAKRKYYMLRSYAAELKKHCVRNNLKFDV